MASEAKQGKGCLECARDSFVGGRLKSNDTFKSEFDSLSKGEYELLSKYKNDNSKVKVKHNRCGDVYEVAVGAFLQGRGCHRCSIEERAINQTWTQDFFEELVKKDGDNEYEVVGKYVNSQIGITIRHLSCNHIYKVRPSDFVSGKRCPRCKASHGEKKIERWLKSEGCEFETQFRFDDCRVERPLPFDFAIFKRNKVIVIEYQGIQHYKAVSIFGGIDGYNKRVMYDNVKRNYCKNNHIELIEIPYYYDDEKIFNTIKEKLCQS